MIMGVQRTEAVKIGGIGGFTPEIVSSLGSTSGSSSDRPPIANFVQKDLNTSDCRLRSIRAGRC